MHLLCNIFLVLICVEHAFMIEYVPPNRKIEAIQNDRYSFGIKDDGEILAEILETHSEKQVKLGEKIRITCPNQITNKFCSIYNTIGEIVETRNCEYDIVSVRMKDIGAWECHTYTSGAMKSTKHTINLIITDPRKVITWKNETDHYVNIGCGYESFGSPISYCKMATPNHYILNIEPGLATDRYLTSGTNFTASRCSLMIQKPLKEFEKGPWRCEMKRVDDGPCAAIITVDNTKPIEYPRYLELTTREFDPLTINCDVPYTIDYCYIVSPDGKNKYIPYIENTLALGRCSHNVQGGSLKDNGGNWTCYIARTTGVPDDKIIVNVAYAEDLQSSPVKVKIGGTAQLMCSARGAPLQHCRYISPEGISYHIRDSDSSSSRITYFGKGLKYGDCGISISNITWDDHGLWGCAAYLLPNRYTEATSTVEITVHG